MMFVCSQVTRCAFENLQCIYVVVVVVLPVLQIYSVEAVDFVDVDVSARFFLICNKFSLNTSSDFVYIFIKNRSWKYEMEFSSACCRRCLFVVSFALNVF